MAKKGRINILSFLLVMKAEEADRYMLCTPKRTEWKAHGKNILRKKDLKHVVVEGGDTIRRERSPHSLSIYFIL